jgi:hypothetical protein
MWATVPTILKFTGSYSEGPSSAGLRKGRGLLSDARGRGDCTVLKIRDLWRALHTQPFTPDRSSVGGALKVRLNY